MAATKSGGRPRAWVTGASSGIGTAFAQRLARDGFDVVLVARNQKRLEAVADEIRKESPVAVDVLLADLTEPASLAEVEQGISGDPQLELLVNNAGFGTAGRFHELDRDGEEAEVRCNVIAPLRLAHAALGAMVVRGHGAIINVSSIGGLMPTPFNATYGSTKAFLVSFTEGLREELRGTGVKVQVLCPGFTRTEFQERAGVKTDAIPNALWMSAEAVADESIHALERNVLICVPGRMNRVYSSSLGLIPRALVRRLGGIIGSRIPE
jgi:short-subunit dehydrogenase